MGQEMVTNRLKNWFDEYGYLIIKSACVLFFTCAILAFGYYWVSKSKLGTHEESKLTDIAHQRRDALLRALDEQKDKSFALAHNPEFTTSFKAFNLVFNPSNAQQDYKKEEATLDQFFNQYRAHFNYKDILLIQADGTIFYSNKIDILGKEMYWLFWIPVCLGNHLTA